MDLKTCTSPTMDGHTYEVVQIGEQCWFAENLRTTEFTDGTPIPAIGPNQLANTKTPARIINPDLPDHYNTFYNGWSLLQTKGICPKGWRVPTAIEFSQLHQYTISTSTAPFSQVKGAEFCDPTDWDFTTTDLEFNRFGFNAQPSGSIALEFNPASHIEASQFTSFWTRFDHIHEDPSDITKIPIVSINEERFLTACGGIAPDYGLCLRCILEE